MSGKGSLDNIKYQTRGWNISKVIVGIVSLFFCVLWFSRNGLFDPKSSFDFELAGYAHLASHCANIPPISESEYYGRQIELAKKLYALNASAYIAEPGANSQFYGNFSNTNWKLSERPLLLIISPVVTYSASESDHASFVDIQPEVTILTPKVPSLPSFNAR